MRVVLAYCHQCDRGAVSRLGATAEKWAQDHATAGVLAKSGHHIDLVEVEVQEKVHVARS